MINKYLLINYLIFNIIIIIPFLLDNDDGVLIFLGDDVDNNDVDASTSAFRFDFAILLL